VDAERWKQAKAIVLALLELESRARGERLAELCDGDPELRREVQSLLDAGDEAAGFLSSPAFFDTVTLSTGEMAEALPVGSKIGPYQVVREIGSGGMGVVYLAVRQDEIRKQVAVKVVKPGMDTAFVLQRFRNERRISAAFSHPNIIMLFDGGSTPDGHPYFATEYVEGEPIDAYCVSRSLSTSRRLELLQRFVPRSITLIRIWSCTAISNRPIFWLPVRAFPNCSILE
jgi:serine/threonine protein kinase